MSRLLPRRIRIPNRFINFNNFYLNTLSFRTIMSQPQEQPQQQPVTQQPQQRQQQPKKDKKGGGNKGPVELIPPPKYLS